MGKRVGNGQQRDAASLLAAGSFTVHPRAEVRSHPHRRYTYMGPGALAYERDEKDHNLVVRLAAAGARHWSFEAVEKDRLGWLTWWFACLSLALRKRFREPSVNLCHYC